MFGVDVSQVKLGAGLRVADQGGAPVPRTGDRLRIEGNEATGQRAVLPLQLTGSQGLAPFQDPESGVRWRPEAQGGLLVISPPSTSAPASVALRLGPFARDGQEAAAPILASEFSLGPVETAGGVVHGAVRVAGSFRDPRAGFRLEIQPVPIQGVRSALDRAATGLGLRLVDIAFMVHVEAGNAVQIISSTVEISAEDRWVDIWSPENIRIMRVTEAGEGRFLETAFRRERTGSFLFSATSPQGFSSFALVAVGPDALGAAVIPSRNGVPWLGIIFGGVALGTLGIGGLLLLRGRSSRASRGGGG